MRKNAAGYAVYVLPNKTDGNGAKKEHMVVVRCLTLDLDGAPLPERWKVEPQLILETSPGRYQCFWTIEPTDDFAACENSPSASPMRYRGDPSAADITHVFRVAGFVHQKGKPFRSRIAAAVDPDTVKIGSFERYALDDFNFLPAPPDHDEAQSAPASGGLQADKAGLLFGHMDPAAFGSNESWLPARNGPA